MTDIEENTLDINNKLTQSQRSMLYRYNVFFTIKFKEIINDVAYYTLYCGLGNNLLHNNKVMEYYEIKLRFSELRKLKINLSKFPNRTLFNYTNNKFIDERVNKLNQWIASVLEDGEGLNLFNIIRHTYT